MAAAALLFVALTCACVICSVRATSISNVVPRTDDTGAIMDIHDGNTLRGADGTGSY